MDHIPPPLADIIRGGGEGTYSSDRAHGFFCDFRAGNPSLSCPDFLNVQYLERLQLRARIVVECAQKTLKAEFITEDLSLLAADYASNSGAALAISGSALTESQRAAPRCAESEDALPPCESTER